MTPTQMTLAVLFPVLLTIGVPIYVSLGLTGFAVAYSTDSPMQFASQTILNGVNQYPLLAIPAFILAGNLMEQGGITKHIVDIFRRMFGHIRGSRVWSRYLPACFSRPFRDPALAPRPRSAGS